MFKIKDKKAFIFYFLMSIIFVDLGNRLRKLSYVPKIQDFFDNSFISIMHVENTGGAFSILQNHTAFLIGWHVYKEIRYKDKAELISLTLFSAGTLGNLIERILNGKVVDYIKLEYFNFPVFNAFDIMICLGILAYTAFVVFEFNISPFIYKKDLNEKNSDK